jgi:hypothetical protein
VPNTFVEQRDPGHQSECILHGTMISSGLRLKALDNILEMSSSYSIPFAAVQVIKGTTARAIKRVWVEIEIWETQEQRQTDLWSPYNLLNRPIAGGCISTLVAQPSKICILIFESQLK